MVGPDPLDVAELVVHCLTYLHSPRDLKACALVSRLWVYAAQSRLFAAPNITKRSTRIPELAWGLLLDTLTSSPHLVSHIRHLVIELSPERITTLSRICSFQFTHLKTVVVILCDDGLRAPAAMALQPLFGLPALRRIKLECAISDAQAFTHLWDRCCPGLKAVTLACNSDDDSMTTDSMNSIASLPAHSIALESFYMLSTRMLDYRLMENACPFDFSKLKFLCIGWRARVPWLLFTPAVRNIEALDIVVNGTTHSLVLSSLPKLASLRIYLPSWIPAQKTQLLIDQLFSGIGAANVVRTIVISPDRYGQMDGALCTLLDSKLSSLPMPHQAGVELEMDREDYDGIWLFFPRLNSRNALRRTDAQVAWW
ncbi:hypothetical protein K438DRAFT_1753939 [Mycena galopus ATCC 62051]|nr:hypothetical protein K438DRAFT_1753939 [Mycena galopus ATCC 62051]